MTRRRAGALVGVVAVLAALVLVIGLDPARPSAEVALADGVVSGGPPGVTIPAPTATALVTTSDVTTSTVRGPTGSGQAVTIAFGGDTHFEAGLRSRLVAEGAAMLDPLGELTSGADLTVLNLETAITDRGRPQPKEWTFRAPASALDVLAAAGVDAVSMANNHGLDFGPDGLSDSLVARASAPVAVIGIGQDAADAYTPFRATVRGQRIAVIAATQVLDEELVYSWTARDAAPGGVPANPGVASAKTVSRLTGAVAEARATADTVVVFLHWGQEREECPTSRQQDLAPVLLAAGADIVVGSHAHRLLGAGRMGDGFVAYGLGNFIWFNEQDGNGETGVLAVTATGRHIDAYEWRPARIRNGVPTRLEGEAAATAQVHWQSLRACTGLAP